MNDFLPPQALDVERTVLGSMIIDRRAAAKVFDALDEGAFYPETHRLIFACMKEMSGKGIPIEIISLAHALRTRGVLERIGEEPYLAELAENIASPENIAYYATILREKARLRRLIEISDTLRARAGQGDEKPEELIEEAKTTLDAINCSSDAAAVYAPCWNNRPEHREPVVRLAGEPILHVGNISILIACPGAGKSAICEAIAAHSINDACDAFGVTLCENCRTAYFDTERAHVDHWNGWDRMVRRAEVRHRDLVPVTFESLKMLRSNQERRRYIERSIASGYYNLIIIDGIGDLVKSVNDEIEAVELVGSLLALATRFNTAILATIHDNPQAGNEKARGWIGSEAMRKAESVVKVKLDRETEQRTITTDFSFGKVRNASGKLESFFTWDEFASMFVSCENALADRTQLSAERYARIVDELRSIKEQWTFAELVEKSAEIAGKPGQESVGKGIYRRLRERKLIVQGADKVWTVAACR